MRDLRPLTLARDVARYRLTRATAADTATLVALNDDASAWLTARGVRQWPAGGYNAETVAHALGAGHELYLALRDGEPVGKFSLQWEDADLWGQRPPDAGYLHGLCVRRGAAGLGAALLDWAGARVAATGRGWLRLDCVRGHQRRVARLLRAAGLRLARGG